MLKDLIIYQKHYDLILYAFPIIAQYPRNARFTLGQETQNCMIDIARFHAGHITREEMRASVASWIGHCGHADTHTLRSAILGGIRWQ